MKLNHKNGDAETRIRRIIANVPAQAYSAKEIAVMVNCSPGFVHTVVNKFKLRDKIRFRNNGSRTHGTVAVITRSGGGKDIILGAPILRAAGLEGCGRVAFSVVDGKIVVSKPGK